MALSKITKYIWLLDRLYYHRDGLTLVQLQDDWTKTYGADEACQMSDRTFGRLRSETEELFKVDIECVNTCGCYRYRLSSQPIDDDKLRKWLLNTFVVGNRIADSMQLSNRILIEDVPSGYTYLVDILSAMRDSHKVSISYQSFVNSQPRRIVVEPYCLKANKRRWYLLANTDNHLRTYALDRMKNLEILYDTTFSLPDDFDAESYFAHTIGVSVEADDYEVETVRVKIFSDRHKDKYLLTLPLHPTQSLIESNDEYSVFEYRIRPTYEFFHEMLALGDEAEILSPDWVRDDMQWYIENMLRRYKK